MRIRGGLTTGGEQLDDDAGQRQLAGILNAVRVGVDPDVVTRADRPDDACIDREVGKRRVGIARHRGRVARSAARDGEGGRDAHERIDGRRRIGVGRGGAAGRTRCREGVAGRQGELRLVRTWSNVVDQVRTLRVGCDCGHGVAVDVRRDRTVGVEQLHLHAGDAGLTCVLHAISVGVEPDDVADGDGSRRRWRGAVVHDHVVEHKLRRGRRALSDVSPARKRQPGSRCLRFELEGVPTLASAADLRRHLEEDTVVAADLEASKAVEARTDGRAKVLVPHPEREAVGMPDARWDGLKRRRCPAVLVAL